MTSVPISKTEGSIFIFSEKSDSSAGASLFLLLLIRPASASRREGKKKKAAPLNCNSLLMEVKGRSEVALCRKSLRVLRTAAVPSLREGRAETRSFLRLMSSLLPTKYPFYGEKRYLRYCLLLLLTEGRGRSESLPFPFEEGVGASLFLLFLGDSLRSTALFRKRGKKKKKAVPKVPLLSIIRVLCRKASFTKFGLFLFCIQYEPGSILKFE